MLLKPCFLIMKLNTVKFIIQDKVVVYREQLKKEEKQFKCQFPLKTTVSMTVCVTSISPVKNECCCFLLPYGESCIFMNHITL